uniref:Nuclear protein MDM1 n=1 Tax=Culicoides sonorensis TaxID=179676 RepID=A0A336M2Z4_CULSO
MIGSFWNLCRACPSMPVDKLHSEYKSTYRWHEFSGPEVVRKPPVPNQFASSKDHFFSKSTENEKPIEATSGPINEPPLPRRKKNPELAYRSHEFIGGIDRTDSANRARSGERGTPSRRSKSEGPPVPNGRCVSGFVGGLGGGAEDHVGKTTGKAGESNGLLRKTIEKLSTEYRIQFVWPNVRRAITGGSADRADPPRKSISMGAIKSAHTYNIPTVHKKRTTNEKEGAQLTAPHELEPLFRDEPDTKHEKRHIRPNNYQFDKEKFGFEPEAKAGAKIANGIVLNHDNNKNWVKEVLELRKKAGEYKTRAWGIEINPELAKKQAEVFDQISRRSSLSALSLEPAIKPLQNGTKDESSKKDDKPPRPRIPGQARPVGMDRSFPDGLLIRAKIDNVRYHLGKNLDDNDIALLISPTREKLMPAIPKGSPQKTAKTISPRSSPKKRVKVRSQSVGPTVSDRSGSPKKQARSGSTFNTLSGMKSAKRTPVSTPTVTAPDGRRPRPTTLSTTKQSRKIKSRSLPPSSRVYSAPPLGTNNKSSNASSLPLTKQNLTLPLNSRHVSKKPQHSIETINELNAKHVPNYLKKTKASAIKGSAGTQQRKNLEQKHKMAAETDDEHDTASGTTTGPSSLQHPDIEHIIKSPPEPTRVKSPEQIIMRSPDPVNWTVPLDTGKTFTVTQNVREGDTSIRPHSEFKASTPLGNAPIMALIANSAPPSLDEQHKLMTTRSYSCPDENSRALTDQLSTASTISNPSTTTIASTVPAAAEKPADKPVPGNTIRCLEDPKFTADINSPLPPTTTTRPLTSTTSNEVVDEARDRFDRYWSKPDTDSKEAEK